MRVVVVAPHPDDAELGMGGTIARLVAEGHDVLIADLTSGEPTPFGSEERRVQEAAEATRILGCRRVNLGMPNRTLTHTVEHRHTLAGLLRTERCEILFAPHPEDSHPDHLAATRIAEDARFDAKLSKSGLPGDPIHPRRLVHYYCTHLRTMPTPSFGLDISAHASTKRRSIEAYASQVKDPPHNHGLVAAVEARDAFVGTRLGVAAAEPFWCRELPGLRGLEALL